MKAMLSLEKKQCIDSKNVKKNNVILDCQYFNLSFRWNHLANFTAAS